MPMRKALRLQSAASVRLAFAFIVRVANGTGSLGAIGGDNPNAIAVDLRATRTSPTNELRRLPHHA